MKRVCWEFICGAPTIFQGYGIEYNRISACSLSLKDHVLRTCTECSTGPPCILFSFLCVHSAYIIAIAVLRVVLMKAVLLVGSVFTGTALPFFSVLYSS